MSVTFWAEKSETPDLHDLNVANGNASIVYRLLGLKTVERCFEELPWWKMPGRIEAMESMNLAELTRDEVIDGNVVHCGATLAQVESYRRRMIPILEHCILNECSLLWG
jgi:hypothetical protein